MMHPLKAIKQNKLFCILVIGALMLAGIFVVSAIKKSERQSWFLEIQLHKKTPPYEIVHLYATKKEFDNLYELERYWGFDHIDHLQNIFVPRKILVFFGERGRLDATPTEISIRMGQEAQRAGITVAAWRDRLKERELSETEGRAFIREKIIAEKIINRTSGVELREDEMHDFYERFLRNSSNGKPFDELSPVQQEDARQEATRYKKFVIIGYGNQVADYEKIVFSTQKMYLCRKSS